MTSAGGQPRAELAEGVAIVAPDVGDLRLPSHVAIIMDGNGRWAKEHGLPRIEGHREGAESVRAVTRAARAVGVEWLTLFAFSAQNWDRPGEETSALMQLLYQYVVEERDELMDNDIRLTAIGDLGRLPVTVRKALSAMIALSAKNRRMTLCLSLSYGGREDVVYAARQIAAAALEGKLDIDDIDEECLSSHLRSAILPPVDLLIRTSGELRVSNFLPWQIAYAELLFTKTMWPEFRRDQFLAALHSYGKRERRYGLVSEQVQAGQV